MVYFLAAPKNKLDLLPDTPLIVGPWAISPVSKCRNLGVFDSALTMKHQVKSAAKAAFYHLRLIARIRRFLHQSAVKALVHAFVMSRLDYCNSLFADLPKKSPHTYSGYKMPLPGTFSAEASVRAPAHY